MTWNVRIVDRPILSHCHHTIRFFGTLLPGNRCSPAVTRVIEISWRQFFIRFEHLVGCNDLKKDASIRSVTSHRFRRPHDIFSSLRDFGAGDERLEAGVATSGDAHSAL